jgi:hypothetical protein
VIGAARSLAAFAALAAALVLAPAAVGGTNVPTGLHGFLLRADEPAKPTHVFSRTPAFAWNLVSGAERYEFQLSTSKTFADNALVWEDTSIVGPLTTVPLTLPWISGARYSWFARVRAVIGGEEQAWSAPFGFNMRASGAPRSLSNGTNPNPGMIRWTPVQGATAYEIVFLYDFGQGSSKKIRSATTAADLREYYTFHNDFPSAVFWRVRAVREIEGKTLNDLPVVSYGPWSAKNRTVEPSITSGPVQLLGSVSRGSLADVQGTAAYPGAHELTPGFWWSGTRTVAPDLFGACPQDLALVLLERAGAACPLFHVYVYTDADCVNRVHVSDLVGSPAYVPRLTGPLDLPADPPAVLKATNLFLADGDNEGSVYDAGNEEVVATGVEAEEATATATTDSGSSDSGGTGGTGGSSGSSGSGTSGSTPGSSGSEGAPAPTEEEAVDRRTSLWDNDWPTSRYYWVVVPAVPYVTVDKKVEYHDVAFPEDLCASGQVMSFGKTSLAAPTTASGVPYASGLSSDGKLVAATTATPTFFGKPVIAWEPAPSAQTYEIQWSKKAYPWKTAGKLATPATAALLELPDGTWFYRVRGLDQTLPGPAGLSWSDPVQIQIVPPTYQVVSKSEQLRRAKLGRRK